MADFDPLTCDNKCGIYKAKYLWKRKGQPSVKSMLLFALFGSCIYCVSNVHGQAPNVHTQQSIQLRSTAVDNPSTDSNCELFYIIVSTIDGKVSALDLHTKGKQVWSLEADSKPLYSSSLANMEMVRNGKKMRLIPSLDGALYQYDGEKVEAIPMSAETLLSSTYRLSDDSMIVGSKELKNFGIDITTGQILFRCGSDGCQHAGKAAEDNTINGNSVLVVTRNTQVVRSVDIKNGQEKWNFSVGQHEIRLPPASHTSQIDDEGFDDDENDEASDGEKIPLFTPFKQCPHEEKYATDADYKDFLRLVVPEGRVVVLDKEDSSLVDWEHKFESPIAKAWLYKNGQLESLSLFDGRHVPTINEQAPEDRENESLPQPLLYIGSFQKLLYIQASPHMETVLRSFPTSRIGHVLDPNIQVAWKPYLNTVLTNKNISIRTRRRALECYIEPILMYGCEAWTISKQTQKKLEATEMWFLRRMLRISWTAKKTNDTVLEEAHTTRLLISKIRKRQATFFGHVMRREKLENLVTTGMLEGKRSRGKQREKLIEGLTDWLKAGKSLEAIEATKDRKKWRTMIANAPDRNRIGRHEDEKEKPKSNSLTVWHEDYPFDTGYFLYPEFSDSRSKRKGLVMRIQDLHQRFKSETGDGSTGYVPVVLSKYWLEVLVMSIILTVAVHFILSRYFNIGFQTSPSFSSIEASGSNSVEDDRQELVSTSDSQPDGLDYSSRFVTDFECLRCLGAGGFGVVFEAVNKVDEQHYAVKRIMLPKSDGAKEKVLREVKALAKLDHTGIVRFFHAWVESPPVGWQEERDKQFLPSDMSGTGTNFSPTPSLPVTPENQRAGRLAQKRKQCLEARARKLQAANYHGRADLIPEVQEEASLEADATDSMVFSNNNQDFSRQQAAGSSGEFSVHSNLSLSKSGSHSTHHSPKNNLISFGFDNLASSRESSISGSRSSVPFSNYSSTSSMALSHPANPTDNDMTGDSVVFESSSCTGTGTESVVFANTSGKPLTNTSPQMTSKSEDLAIDITLSSHRGDEEEDKQTSHISNTGAKLYLYIQMQLYREDTLKDWLSNNTLNRDRHSVLTIFDEIVCAVDYVHKQGLMHRDLKPSNIFFSADGHVKVGDFGLATAVTVQHDQNAGDSTSLSEKHTAEVGTTLYMSPEQIANKPYDLKVDIFSMGLIFLELWVPFSTQMERIQTLKAAKKQCLPERFIKELPDESGLVSKMTCKDPGKRPVTDEILDHSLFQDIAFLRSDHRARKRTISEKSA
ncbi:eukaryotic translation initiation factor 2-alpha kinase 3-like [Plakobranchus ocellatus]|uniref:non-specific serine/threonine protein kinase n=1 Tax=Plakobranchus ocellatus TaxID=259542 RepID=A0AAV4AIA1_9GAST|nr:eukaryotic translation initiation factor 2-alpha kinase 3-like [Plakobranchus ocellatus]